MQSKKTLPIAAESAKRHVRAKVIAARYDVSERCVFNWADQGRIPSIAIGKTRRFDLEAVIAAIEPKEVSP